MPSSGTHEEGNKFEIFNTKSAFYRNRKRGKVAFISQDSRNPKESHSYLEWISPSEGRISLETLGRRHPFFLNMNFTSFAGVKTFF